MNKFIIFTLSLLALYSCKNAGEKFNSISINHSIKATVPETILTPETLYWKASPVTAPQFVNTATEAGKILKAKFEKNGTFKFYYNEMEVSGTVAFTRNKQGKNILTTHATSCNSKHAATITELNTTYSNTYLWERISFRDMPSEDFLLLVDLDAHPAATSGSIDKNWVLKFYTR